MARGRKAKTDRPVDWKLRVPTSVAAAINEFLADPLTGEPPLGARSELTVRLYKEFLAQLNLKR